MSTTVSRRNGTQASCEPCRKSKVRCDHQKPVCTRCRRRRIDTRCCYKASPLTKTRARSQSPTSDPLFAPHEARGSAADGCTGQNASAGFDGQNNHPLLRRDVPIGPSRSSTDNGTSRNERLATITEVLGHLKSLTAIADLLDQYYDFSEVALVPQPIILQLITSIEKDSATSGLASQEFAEDYDRFEKLAENVLSATSAQVITTADMSMIDFCGQYSGINLRIETLGLLVAIAARSMIYQKKYDAQKPNGFFQGLHRSIGLSLKLARDVVPQTNDFLVWLAYEDMLLTTLVEGDASLGVWQRLGSLTTDIYALGLHHEASLSHPTIPFFLSELRRKTFVCAYQIDKIHAPIFDRPPRLSKRYADCKLPLDLSNDELFAESSDVIESARQKLSWDGWNTDGKFRSMTWARLRFIVSQFKEETTEYAFFSSTSIDHNNLRELSSRCHEKWQSLPAHLRYDENCWASDLSTFSCMMLAQTYLSYLHVDLQIYRVIAKSQPSSMGKLWEVSANMLRTVLQVGGVRDRETFLPRDLPTMVLAYGLPSAVILAGALQDIVREPSRSLPPGLSWPMLIRNLSVFISQLESVCAPGLTNHVFCAQASRAISKVLDEVLNTLTSSSGATTAVAQEPSGENTCPSPLRMPGNLSIDSSHSTLDLTHSNVPSSHYDLEKLTTFDFADWAMNMDWTSIDSLYT